MSYTIDVYRGEARAQRNILSFGAYVALFPQLIAGPIVRYQTVVDEIDSRSYTIDSFGEGTRRFVCGLGKKVLLANNIGLIWKSVSALPDGQLTTLGVWLGLMACGLQIYFDFSGYSDMAIGPVHGSARQILFGKRKAPADPEGRTEDRGIRLRQIPVHSGQISHRPTSGPGRMDLPQDAGRPDQRQTRGAETADSIYARSYLEGRDQYGVFLNSNQAQTVERGKLLLVKDSFGNSFAQFPAEDYAEVHMLDLRFFRESLTDYIRENGITEVLVVYGVPDLTNNVS